MPTSRIKCIFVSNHRCVIAKCCSLDTKWWCSKHVLCVSHITCSNCHLLELKCGKENGWNYVVFCLSALSVLNTNDVIRALPFRNRRQRWVSPLCNVISTNSITIHPSNQLYLTFANVERPSWLKNNEHHDRQPTSIVSICLPIFCRAIEILFRFMRNQSQQWDFLINKLYNDEIWKIFFVMTSE